MGAQNLGENMGLISNQRGFINKSFINTNYTIHTRNYYIKANVLSFFTNIIAAFYI